MNLPIISGKVSEWQAELQNLGAQRAVEVDKKFTDYAADKLRTMVRIRSNSAAVGEAKQGLQEAIKRLRAMTTRPLSEIHEYITATEARLKSLDFGKLVPAEEPITEGAYQDVIGREEPKVQQDLLALNFPREAAAQRLLRKTAL
jgi:hypothetical protein